MVFYSNRNLSSISPQYKKHRLSVGQTNNYAKSVVNMADFVSRKFGLFKWFACFVVVCVWNSR